VIYSRFEEVRGGIQTWLMDGLLESPCTAYNFLFVIIEPFSLALTVEALQGKTCQRLAAISGGVGQLEPRFQGEGVVSGEYFGSYKTRHILLSDGANCTVLRAVVLTQYPRVTDGQTDRHTDGIAVASTALAIRALRRAVKLSAAKL